jgi:hypothetical protein
MEYFDKKKKRRGVAIARGVIGNWHCWLDDRQFYNSDEKRDLIMKSFDLKFGREEVSDKLHLFFSPLFFRNKNTFTGIPNLMLLV